MSEEILHTTARACDLASSYDERTRSELLNVNDVASLTYARKKIARLPDSFGRNLDSEAKALEWLSNPWNWHESQLFVLKWNNLIPSVTFVEGRRMAQRPCDSGIAWAAWWTQRRKKAGKDDSPATPEDDKQ